VVFSVKDGQAGFPAAWLSRDGLPWQLSIEANALSLTKDGQQIHTGDLVDIDGDRVLFVGRDCHTVNVAGVKVDLERIEHSLLMLPEIVDARIYAKPNPLIGYMLHAEVVAYPHSLAQAQAAFAQWQKTLPKTSQPRFCRWVSDITLNENQKKVRIYA
jgi:non-ribosomal peptide synthetase component E (peptide arylation enzyme)